MPSTVAGAVVLYVKAAASGSQSGTRTAPYASIQTALDDAAARINAAPSTHPAIEIRVAEGVYAEVLNISVGGRAGAPLSLVGDPNAPPVVDAGGAGTGVYVGADEVRLEGLEIQSE